MYKTILFLSHILSVQSSLAPTHLSVTRVGPCYDGPKTSITVSELSITTQTYDSSLSGEMNISEGVSNGWKIKATMQKCVDIRNIDSCDYFKSFFVVRNGCSEEDDDEQEMYSMLFHYANPILECPIQAGRYKILNYPFFTEDNYLTVHESKISTSVFGYTFRLDGFTVDHRKIFCVEAYLQLLYMREHDWINNTDVSRTAPPAAAAAAAAAAGDADEPVRDDDIGTLASADTDTDTGTDTDTDTNTDTGTDTDEYR